MSQDHFDTVVIGAGQSGDPLARALAGAGKRVALIERGAVGGTCVNVGCTPTKTMLASARVAAFAHRSADYGVYSGPVSLNFGEVIRRKAAIVESFRSGTEKHVSETPNLELIRGQARFVSPNECTIIAEGLADRSITAVRFVIDAGARPAIPKITGIESIPYLSSTTIMELDSLPEHLLVLGGGYIAIEFAQMFRRFGSRVTIIQRGSQLLAREDADVALRLKQVLEEDGIDVRLDAQAVSVAKSANGVVLSVADSPSVEGSHLLVATGRTPNTEQLGLELAGVNTDKAGYIEVDNTLRTSTSSIYATGDVKGGPAFTHISYDDFRVLKRRFIDGADASIEGRMVPYTLFTDPQLGRIGLSESEAREKCFDFRIAKIEMSNVARAIEMGETRGFIKILVENKTYQIIGAAVLSMEGGEIMAMIQIAMMGKVPYTALRDGIFAHPTLAELLNNIFMTLDD